MTPVTQGTYGDSGTFGDSVTEHLARTVPVGRLGRPEDLGAAVVFLVSREAAWLTGQAIGLNGGSSTS